MFEQYIYKYYPRHRAHPRQQIYFPGERYAAAANTADGNSDLGGFTLLEFLDANFERTAGNIFVVGAPNFPEPAIDEAYDFVPVGLARRVVRRNAPLPMARWSCYSSNAWAAVAEEFAADGENQGVVASSGAWSSRAYWTAPVQDDSDAEGGTGDGALSLPPRHKYGPQWWESTLRIIVYNAAADTAAYGLERALAVPEIERGTAEAELMVEAALYLEAVFRGYEWRWGAAYSFLFHASL